MAYQTVKVPVSFQGSVIGSCDVPVFDDVSDACDHSDYGTAKVTQMVNAQVRANITNEFRAKHKALQDTKRAVALMAAKTDPAKLAVLKELGLI